MVDIHNYKKRLERTLERIKISTEISEHNKKLILGYHRNCVIEGLSIAKTERYVYDALRLAQFLKRDLDKATEENLKQLVADIESKEWSVHTKYTFKIGLRKFYKFIEGITEKGKSPEKLKWMKTNLNGSQIRLPEDLVTEEEVELMVRNATCTRDKAFIASLYESGCRIGELGSLRIKDSKFDEYGAIIQVHGKTGSRIVRLINSSPYLLEWINQHPQGQNRESFVWSRNDGVLLTHNRMSSILKECAKRAKVEKRVNPHSFRHARATYLAGHLTESQMKVVLGWTAGSDMAGIYVHLNNKDADKAILKMNGVQVEEKIKVAKLQKKECLRCKTQNEFTNRFCKTCGFVLDKEEAENIVKADLEKVEMDNLMEGIVNDKEILRLLVKKIKEKKLI